MHQKVLLDCTLRDGGYYNSWHFDHELIQEYIFAIKDAGVDIVELGFRFLNQDKNKGDCAYTSDMFIKSLIIPQNLKLCVMINASDIITGGKFNEINLNYLFPSHSESSKISIVRIATHTDEFIEALKAVEHLKAKGYKIGFNIMQVSEVGSIKLRQMIKTASDYQIEVLYFADSLGNMNPEKISDVIDTLKIHWKGAIGFHAHDNMALGFSNTLYALENGVNWVDSTVLGMGRGAGNVRTELLAIELAKLRNKSLNLSLLSRLISNKFRLLQSKYLWGTNSFYFLSGKKSVHPSYIQEMLSNSKYNQDDIIAIIDKLGLIKAKKYSKEILHLVFDELKRNK